MATGASLCADDLDESLRRMNAQLSNFNSKWMVQKMYTAKLETDNKKLKETNRELQRETQALQAELEKQAIDLTRKAQVLECKWNQEREHLNNKIARSRSASVYFLIPNS